VFELNQVLQQKYRLKQKLSENVGRQTWKAEDISLVPHEPVIIKLLGFNPQMQWDELKLFEREANILKQISHPYIPKYRDYFAVNDQILWFCLVQTYIPGQSLEDLLTEGRKFSESEIINITINLLEILIYLHELSPVVLHRDIKPSNIILGEDNQVHLVDFGAVQSRAAIEGATFTVVGTYGYTPMEQFGGRAVPASDLYALGATLIHILTGTSPSDLPQQNMRIQFRQYLSISSPIINWIEKLTAPSVEQRFQTSRQALLALTNPEAINQESLILSKPHNSRIRLTKSPDKLEIKLPGRKFRKTDILLILWILILYGATIPFSLIAFPFVILFWLVGLVPISFFLFPIFAQVKLNFDQNQFIFQWRVLGIPYFFIKGSTSMIQKVYAKTDDSLKLNDKPLTRLGIKAKNKTYQFGGIFTPINTRERRWLIQELKSWLGLI
jgi:serine/threonine protein kinase